MQMGRVICTCQPQRLKRSQCLVTRMRMSGSLPHFFRTI